MEQNNAKLVRLEEVLNEVERSMDSADKAPEYPTFAFLQTLKNRLMKLQTHPSDDCDRQ